MKLWIEGMAQLLMSIYDVTWFHSNFTVIFRISYHDFADWLPWFSCSPTAVTAISQVHSHSWGRSMANMQSANIRIHSAWGKADDRLLWRCVINMASWCTPLKRRKKKTVHKNTRTYVSQNVPKTGPHNVLIKLPEVSINNAIKQQMTFKFKNMISTDAHQFLAEF